MCNTVSQIYREGSMKGIIFLFVAASVVGLFFSCTAGRGGDELSVIPRPLGMERGRGSFDLTPDVRVVVDSRNERVSEVGEYLVEKIVRATGFSIPIENRQSPRTQPGAIVLSLIGREDGLGDEGYILSVKKNSITLKAEKPAGLFYGIQTLRQLLPPETESKEQVAGIAWSVPCVEIKDRPRFPWRGMHLDVCRHFFPKEFVKRYIDYLAFHKMNVFHWHLTEDQGWRIEIKKYPKLTEVGAWRVDREDKPWNEREPQREDEKATYGGYYTQDEVREIVEHAESRFINVVPEIEMPGHSVAALAAYPEYSCTGGPFTVMPGGYWPITDIYCAGNDGTFEFLENILSEVIALFPGEYIHIGGDEASKMNWKKCPKCQARIRNEGLRDEEELQSYFIERIEKFLISKGKKLVGWDEILEGGLAPEATVMSWRGMEGGIEAARHGHDVVMCPTSHCYFDYYQADPDFQPEAIGGFITLKKVYSFEPVPVELDADQCGYILGAQGNVWTEYIPTPEHAEYMSLPRMCALAEVVWSPKELRDWKDFRARMDTHFQRLDWLGVNYCEGSFKVDIVPRFDDPPGDVTLVFESEQLDPEIFFTLDGSDPSPESRRYTGPIPILQTTHVKAGIYRNGKLKEKFSEKTLTMHKAVGKSIVYDNDWSHKYPAYGDLALVDGLHGSDQYSDGYWQGFEGNDLDVVIDLGESMEVIRIETCFLQDIGRWIFLPRSVAYSVSDDGMNFREVALVEPDVSLEEGGAIVYPFVTKLDKHTARYLRVRAKNIGICPDWHQGAGHKALIFVDEIVVE